MTPTVPCYVLCTFAGQTFSVGGPSVREILYQPVCIFHIETKLEDVLLGSMLMLAAH